jgi:hypothetical protein
VVFKIFRPATHYQVGKHSSLKEKIRFDRRALSVTSLLQTRALLAMKRLSQITETNEAEWKSLFEVRTRYAVARTCPLLADFVAKVVCTGYQNF